jgi:hypothetical protein
METIYSRAYDRDSYNNNVDCDQSKRRGKKDRKRSEIIETRVSKANPDNKTVHKFAFLSHETVHDCHQNNGEKTNSNQRTNIQQLQSIFGGQQSLQHQQQQIKEKEIEIIAFSDNAVKGVNYEMSCDEQKSFI